MYFLKRSKDPYLLTLLRRQNHRSGLIKQTIYYELGHKKLRGFEKKNNLDNVNPHLILIIHILTATS